MKNLLLTIVFSLLFLSSYSKKPITCLIKTSLGDISIELYADKAPLTVANFLKYVDSQSYDQTNFYRACTPENEKERTVRIQVIQGGDVPKDKELEPIVLETTQKTGLKHLDGTLSMARDTPNSATSSFFICINDQPSLDYAGKRNPDGQGFAAFGKVTRGMNVVKMIQAQQAKGQYLVQPVVIKSIRRMD